MSWTIAGQSESLHYLALVSTVLGKVLEVWAA